MNWLDEWDVYSSRAEVRVPGRPDTPLGVSVAGRAADDATSSVHFQSGNSNNIYLKVQLRTAIIPIIYTDLNKASNAIGVVKMKYI